MTTLDPATLGSGVVLSNGNLTVTGSPPGADSGAFSTTAKSSGLLYFEVTFGTAPGGDTAVGLADSSGTFPSIASGPSNSAIAYGTGPVWVSGGFAFNITAAGNGSVFAIAVNFTTNNFAARNVTAGDNWNGNVANVPDTGGAGIAGLTGVSALKAVAAISSGRSDVLTVNFGASAFSGTVPTSYSSWDPAAVKFDMNSTGLCVMP